MLPRTFGRPELDKRRLGEVVDLFTNIAAAANGGAMDLLGRIYECCLGKFAEQEGKNAGEFYTPTCVVYALVEVIKPFSDRVYDPVAEMVVCLSSLQNSWRPTLETIITFLSMNRIVIPQRGNCAG